MKRILVQYKVRADKAEENKRLIQKVFEELKASAPNGLRYASFTLPDGVSFVHIASIETKDDSNPLPTLDAFRVFSSAIKERCETPPIALELSEIGSYRFF